MSKEKKKGGKLKWVIIVIIVIVVIAAVGGGSSKKADEGKENKESTKQTENSSSDNSTNIDTSNSESTGINEEKYDSIQNGMSYEEVKNIIGEDGENISESEVAGIKTVMYQWSSSDGWGNATVTFQNDEVINKAQFGVSSGDDVEITLEQYNSIETGMSYDEVVSLLGGEGSLLSDSEISDNTSQVYQWNGTSLGANATVTFSNGKVMSKAQFGLE